MTSTTFTYKQIQNLQIKADKYYISKLGFSSKFPRVILRASHKYGGFKQSTLLMTQIYKQLQMLLGSLRDKNETGKLLESSLAYTQLEAGITTPILSQHTSPIFLQYTKRMWIHSVKESLQQINGHITLPNQWHPYLQRRHDTPIMEKILLNHPIYYTDKKGKTRKSKQNIH